jgi:hypothetical protein
VAGAYRCTCSVGEVVEGLYIYIYILLPFFLPLLVVLSSLICLTLLIWRSLRVCRLLRHPTCGATKHSDAEREERG